MKGVSAVIAVILILMITVALAAMAYVWFTSIFQSLTEGAGGAAEQTATALGTSFSVETATAIGTDKSNVSIAIRNTGSTSIDLASMAFYMDNLPANKLQTGNSTTGTVLEPGQVTKADHPFIIANTTTIGDICPGPTVVRITTGSGFSQSTTVICT